MLIHGTALMYSVMRYGKIVLCHSEMNNIMAERKFINSEFIRLFWY